MTEKKLIPSLRENKRYLLLETKLEKEQIKKIILDFLGVLGYAKAGIYFIDEKILAVNREMINEIKAAFACNKDIKVKLVSGSLKKLKRNRLY